MMTQEMQAKLKRSLILHEGKKSFPYKDSVGKITIGIGYNLSDRGMPDQWIDQQYNQDVSYFYNQFCENFPWYLELSEDRQVALVDMAFMGWKKFLTFKKMIAALAAKDYKQAAMEALHSNWALQVGNRATTIASVLLNGTYDI